MRNIRVSTAPVRTTVTSLTTQAIQVPAWAPKAVVFVSNDDTAAIPMIAAPLVNTSRRLRSRRENGLGRRLRGTDQAMFIAFCRACPRPREP